MTIIARHPSDEVMVMASDGLWDVMSNQEAVTLAKKCLGRTRSRGSTRQVHPTRQLPPQLLPAFVRLAGLRQSVCMTAAPGHDVLVLTLAVTTCGALPTSPAWA